MSVARRIPRNEAGVSVKKRRPNVSRLGLGDALNGSVNGYVVPRTKREPAKVGYLNTRRLAVVPFIVDVSIRFAASSIEAHEPTT